MSRSPHRSLVVTVGAVVAAALLGAGTGTAGHAATTRTVAHRAVSGHALAAATLAAPRPAAGAVQQVELALTPRDRSGLATLAKAQGLSRGTRFARLDAALPGTARRAAVAAQLRRSGLTVTGGNDLTVSATGPAATVAALFGTEQAPQLGTSQALPRIPTALTGLVTAAYGGGDTRPAELPLGVTAAAASGRAALTVAQTRSLYGTKATTATPTSTAPIVATLQFTGADTVSTAIDDADTFAAHNSLYGSNSSYQPSSNIAQVAVDASCSSTDGDGDGVEVALDTQTLLAVAPQLRQRVYQAENCGNAQDDAIDNVVSDVQSGLPIVALSTSWGGCEEATYGSTTADVDAVNALLAAGVTMFAASGDNGSFDCVDGNGNSIEDDAVDTPAAIPGVVAVGGTSIDASGSTPVVWNDGLGSASGGGFSCGEFAKPSYQAKIARTGEYPNNGFGCPTGRAERMVPDIAENGGNGIDAYVTDSHDSDASRQVYGTSFAAPLAAGGFAQTIVNAGRTTGLGDIHALLYAAPGLTDVVSGRNGDYRTGPGYDLASGLGAPTWPAVLGPRVGRAMSYEDPTLGPTVSVGYAGTAALGVAGIHMTVTDQDGNQVASYSGTSGGHATFDAVPGSTYVESVTVQDAAGTSATAGTTLIAPLDEHTSMQFSPNTGWRVEQYSLNWQHTDTATVVKGAEGKIVVTTKALSVLVRTGPSMGEARFYVDGHLVRTFDSYSPSFKARVVVPLATFSSDGSHTLQVFVLGGHSARSTGNGVRIDAILAQQ